MIYKLEFDSGDIYIGSTSSGYVTDPRSVKSAKRMYGIKSYIHLDEDDCTLEDWIKVFNPSLNRVSYSNVELLEVQKLYEEGKSYGQIAKITDVHYDTVKNICKGVRNVKSEGPTIPDLSHWKRSDC